MTFNVHTAHADWEWPKLELPHIELPHFDWPKIELPHFELPTFTIPGTNFVFDPKLGLDGLKDIANLIPDKIDVPGTSFSIYPKESAGANIIKNLSSVAGDLVGFLDPFKPAASAARLVLGWVRPIIEPLIKQILPTPVKGAFFAVKTQINNIVKSLDNPLIQNILLPIWDFFVGPIDDLAMEIVDILAEEETAPGAGPGGQHEITSGPPQMILSSPFVNEKPIGAFDAIDANGIATGWALDPNNPSESINVRLSPMSGGAIIIPANQPRSDLNQPGNHGFSFRIPSSMRNGILQSLDAFAIDSHDSSIKVQLNSSQSYRLYEEAFGALNTITTDGTLIGWAIDPDRATPPEVKFYLDESTYIGSATANQAYTYATLPDTLFAKVPHASRNVGFTFQIDPEKYRDGIRHVINAFAVNTNDNGETKEVLLADSPVYFSYPKTLQVTFSEDPLTVIAGSRVFQTINGISSKHHSVQVLIDDKPFDVNSDKHSYPFYIGRDDYWLRFSDGTDSSETRSAKFNFKLPEDIALGEHTVTFDASVNEYQGFVYKASFKINVVAYEPMVVVVPDVITPETEFDVQISKIPHFVKLTGDGANATVKGIFFSSESGSYTATPSSVTENGDGTAVAHVAVPYELSRIRKDRGPISAGLWVTLENDLAKEEFRLPSQLTDKYFDAKTAAGTDPILEPLCKSTNTPTLTVEGGEGVINGSGANFTCWGDFTVTVSGVNKGKDFSFVLDKNYWYGNAATTIPPMAYAPKQIEWNGELKSFGINTTETWTQNYTTVEDVTVTITDSAGNSASAKVHMPSPYQVRVLPLEGDTLIPGDYFRLAFKGFQYGHQMNLNIDGESTRQFYIREGLKGSDDGFAYYDELYIPTWLTSGKHTLVMQDMTALDAKGKPLYKAETTFMVGGSAVNTNGETQDDTGKSTVTAPTVSVNPVSVKAGSSVDITMTGFGPLGTVTIYLRPAATPDSGGTKLSGYADYTDSSGSLVKQGVQISSSLSAGQYVIVVTDTQNLKATTNLTIEAAADSKKTTTKESTKESDTTEVLPTVDTTEPVVEEPAPDLSQEETTPVCATGSTYSPTFKMCIEDAPEESSPYEGLPCNESIPLYAQKGCIE